MGGHAAGFSGPITIAQAIEAKSTCSGRSLDACHAYWTAIAAAKMNGTIGSTL
jgi:hypothetical protein